jgi:hypothetical protein
MTPATFSAELTNAIIQYIGSKPFSEVAGLMGAIQNELQAQGQSIVMQSSNPPVDAAANDAASEQPKE